MRIAPIAQVATTVPVAPSAIAVPAPMLPGSLTRDPSPVEIVSKRYTRDLLAINGVASTSFSNRVADELTIGVDDTRTAAVLAGLIRPVVDGVRLTIVPRDTNVPYTGPAATSVAARVRAVAAMSGVWNYYYTGLGQANARVTFETVDQQTIDRLRALIVDRFAAGVDGAGNPRVVEMTWRAGLPHR